MSSSYPPFGNAPVRPCQRCGMPLPPNEVYCGNCGQYNVNQLNNSVAQSSSNPFWGAAAPQTSSSSDQNAGPQWGQLPVQDPHIISHKGGIAETRDPAWGAANNGFQGPHIISDKGGIAETSRNGFQGPHIISDKGGIAETSRNGFQVPQSNPVSGYPVPQQPFGPSSQPGNFYGAPTQQSNPNNFYEAAGQPARQSNFYSGPQAPFSPQQAPFSQPQAPFSPQQAPFGSGPLSQPMGPGSQPGAINGYQQGNFSQPPQRKSRPRVALIIGVVVLLVVLIGGGVFGYFTLMKPQKTTQATVAATPTPVPKGQPLFKDTFASNNNGWDTTSRAGQFSVKIGNGSMVLEDDNNKLLWEVVPGGKNFGDFFLTTDVVLSKGTADNGYGIYIRSASNVDVEIATYYRFELYGDGTFAIYKGTVDTDGTSKSNFLVNYTTSSAILKQGQVNHIAVGAKGTTLTFIVNGQTLKAISDNSYASGSIALFVSNLPSTTPGAQATFSNFVIYPPQT